MVDSQRRNLSFGRDATLLLDQLAVLEGCTAAEAVYRSMVTRIGFLELVAKIPRDDRGRLARLCVLPESAEVPEGAEVFRLYVPLDRDGVF